VRGLSSAVQTLEKRVLPREGRRSAPNEL